MPVRYSRFEPDHFGINGFLHSDQLRDAVEKGADDVVGYAKPESSTLAPHWRVSRGRDMVIGAYSRLTMEVVNEHEAAAAIEFGSGAGRPGQTGIRRQGGYSFPNRILGKAGARVGDLHSGEEI